MGYDEIEMNEINEREKWRGENNFGFFSLCKKNYFIFILIAF